MQDKYEKYIDTAVDGMVFDIEHNLQTMSPLVFLYEPVGLSDLRSVSLYDSRLGFVESKGKNVSRVSFNNAFQGYIYLIDSKVPRVSFDNRISRIENLLNDAINQQKSLVTLSQWKELNNLEDTELSYLKEKIAILDGDLETLRQEIDNL